MLEHAGMALIRGWNQRRLSGRDTRDDDAVELAPTSGRVGSSEKAHEDSRYHGYSSCHTGRVSNSFTAGGSPHGSTGLRLSNGATDVLFDSERG